MNEAEIFVGKLEKIETLQIVISYLNLAKKKEQNMVK